MTQTVESDLVSALRREAEQDIKTIAELRSQLQEARETIHTLEAELSGERERSKDFREYHVAHRAYVEGWSVAGADERRERFESARDRLRLP